MLRPDYDAAKRAAELAHTAPPARVEVKLAQAAARGGDAASTLFGTAEPSSDDDDTSHTSGTSVYS